MDYDGVASYTTNFGQVEVNAKTHKLLNCCIGLGRNQENTAMSIKIDGNEFQIFKDSFNTIYAELCSKNFPYPANCSQSIDLTEILQMLWKDDNFSVAAILVKKRLVELMYKKLKFSDLDLNYLHKIFESWRKPILKSDLINRIPIITRTPIRR